MRLTVVSLIFTVLFAAFIAGCSRKASEQPVPVETEAETEKAAPPEEPPALSTPESPAATPEEAARKKLFDPAQLNETAPETFRAKFTTSKGDFTVEVTRAWAPNGADRFYNMVKNGYYNDCRFFRVVSDFMVQFGINGDPSLNQVWSQARFKDDPVKESNKRGYVTFAMADFPDSRTTQVFINYKDNSFLDAQRFAPFGRVIEGMNVIDSFFNEYREAPSNNQQRIQSQGNAYLNNEFPKLDYVKSASII